MMRPEESKEEFHNEEDAYQEDAIQNYGEEAIKKSKAFLSTLEKFELEQLKKEQKDNFNKLYSLIKEDPTSDLVQYEIVHHYQIIRQFWGTSNSKDKQAEAYAGLGDLYVHDERFMLVDGKYNAKFADFLCKAMKYFVKTQLG